MLLTRLLSLVVQVIVSIVSTASFFFNYTATPEIYTLSYTTLFRSSHPAARRRPPSPTSTASRRSNRRSRRRSRSEEHTSELQSLRHLVCRLLLEKKKKPV